MKRDDFRVGQAAEAAETELSTDERALNCDALPTTRSTVEREQDWLYFHLICARNCAARMDRMLAWGIEYVNEYRSRELALAGASRHYRRLRVCNAPIPPLLINMILREGLAP